MSLKNRPIVGRVIALLAGAALPLAFAPYEIRILAVLCPAVLFWLWGRGNKNHAVLSGFLFGLGMFGTGTHWIYYSLTLFGDAIAPLATVITAGFVMWFAAYFAVLAWIVCRFFRHEPNFSNNIFWLIGVLPALWSLCELFRGWFLTGFPWLSLGYSQIDSWLSGYAPVLGVYGVSWMVAMSSGAVVALIISRNRDRCIAAVLLAAIWGGGFALKDVEWSEPLGEPISVRMVQGNIEQHHKFMAELLESSIETYKNLSYSDEPIDLIVWPESAIPTFFYKIDQKLADFSESMLARGTRVLTGGFIYDRNHDRYYNSLRMLDDPDAFYHKQHLVPFGEYLPFRPLIGFLRDYITIPMSDLSPGVSGGKGLSIKGHVIAPSICYEDAFGEEMIKHFPDAGLLLNVSNDSWFGDSAAPHQHLEMARMRALEFARPMVRVTNTGVSAVIDDKGEPVAVIDKSRAGGETVMIRPRYGEGLPFVFFGNAIVLVVVISCLVMAQFFDRLVKRSGTVHRL